MEDTTRVIETLLRRLTDSALASVIAGLTAACNARPGCRSFLAMEQTTTIGLHGSVSENAVVRGTDVFSGDWSLLFSTPFYQTTLPGHETLNPSILALIDRERDLASRSASPASASRSLAGSNSWRTNDQFLLRKEAPIKKLYKFLLERSKAVVQYGQPSPLDLDLHLSGWAISLGRGGRQTEHVHPHASWSGVYYVRIGGASKHRGGCLRVTDPRPAAMMVTLGPNDQQFMEARTICPQPGLLVMFPSWLNHGVTPLEEVEGEEEEDGTRVAVAFNVHGAERER